MSNTNIKKIVIAGGGFAGVSAARKLARDRNLEITLVSRDSTFEYYPQLYHSATGGTRSESAIPLVELFSGSSVKVITDTVKSVDPSKKVLVGEAGSYAYDELIIALGVVTNYFGIKGLKEYAYGIKSITAATEFKQHLHRQLVEEGQPEPNYVVIGAGPTGVELAGALGGYLQRITKQHNIPKPSYKIDLVEAADRVLPRSSTATAARVTNKLQKLGVNVLTSKKVLAETADALQMDGMSLSSKTVIWTAGVANNPFFADNPTVFRLGAGGRVEVDRYLSAAPHIYVLGDNAITKYGGLAEVAVRDGAFAAKNILRISRGSKPKPYHQKRPISVIPVGSHWAAVNYGIINFYGYAGWILRRLADLVGYSDIEGRSKAWRTWLSDGRYEDDCPVCHQLEAAAAK